MTQSHMPKFNALVPSRLHGKERHLRPDARQFAQFRNRRRNVVVVVAGQDLHRLLEVPSVTTDTEAKVSTKTMSKTEEFHDKTGTPLSKLEPILREHNFRCWVKSRKKACFDVRRRLEVLIAGTETFDENNE